jgi:ketosteroid isomerase-like protein
VTTQEDNVALLRAWLDEYQRGGDEGASERFAEQLCDPEVEFSPFLARETEGRAYQGVGEVPTFFRELHDVFGEVRYEQPTYHPRGDDLVVAYTRLTGLARGGAVRMGQDLGLLFGFREGRVRRLTAYGSHDEAMNAAEEMQRA